MHGGERGPGRGALAVVLLAVAQILVVFDTAVFAVGLPLIQFDRHLSFSGLTWLLSVYSVCFAALPVLAGALGRALGHRRVLMGGFALSSLAAAAPALSTAAWVLLASRAVQGVAAAVITAGALALIDATHPAGRDRDRALNMHFAVVACATPAVLLPCTMLLDSVRTANTVFWVQAVAGLVLLVLTPVALAETEPVPGARSRVGGAALAVVPLGFLAWFADWLGGRSVSVTTVIVIAVGAALLPSALGWLGRGERVPALLSRLYRERVAFGAYTVVALLAAGLAGAMIVLMFALQLLGNLSPMQVGWALLPAVAGVVLGCAVLPVVAARAGLAGTVAGACVVAAGGFVLLGRPGAGYGFGAVQLPLLLIAFGCGVLALPAGFARGGSGALPQELNSSRQFGAGLGASMFVGVITVAERNTTTGTLAGLKEYKVVLAHEVRHCFDLGTALCLTAALIALLALPRRAVPAAGPEPRVSGGAPAGTAGSPGSSGR
ncbi:MFS transporter [Streptomyces camelliae]|uniref:MFS transporter n=1 Tax=Streptomyces camelliae TaxID=3004093 RepID=A0ABY7NYL9_9ACTN|nr:MFS transporter [Streptomyces sp. HUAS 2-6]WBO62410.1 MFS transporter [Streptomyces sp. HUAS 2-6]